MNNSILRYLDVIINTNNNVKLELLEQTVKGYVVKLFINDIYVINLLLTEVQFNYYQNLFQA